MTRPVDDSDERRWLQLSALCDGEAGLGEAQDSFERWRDDPSLRERWHSYQWIGDVMRSDDLASAAEHDQAFVLALRERLAREPVVLAPARQEPAAAAPIATQGLAMVAGGRRMRWSAPAAMAAGVMAVAGALVVIRSTGPVEPAASSSLAQAQPEVIRVVGPVPAAPASDAAIGPMLRDADLDRYFEAHRQFARGPALSAPSAVQQVVVKAEGR
jgi:sigma-E factor negative regulatory protein RseA